MTGHGIEIHVGGKIYRNKRLPSGVRRELLGDDAVRAIEAAASGKQPPEIVEMESFTWEMTANPFDTESA